MSRITVLAGVLVVAACAGQGGSGTPAGFPFPVSLPASVTTKGVVSHARMARHEFALRAGKENVEGEKWSGHVRIEGFGPRDASFLPTLEQSLIKGTGWESVYRDDTRDPPMATLRRTLGGEILWISLEGWADDLTVTVVHRK
jgi:hypothetical protein